jgi:hypothetical protein
VFNAPAVTRALEETDPSQFAEFSRNDESLSYRPDMPVMASAEWPERERASLAYPRTIFLSTRADELTFFENESRYRGTGGYYRSTTIAPGNGAWGFWR